MVTEMQDRPSVIYGPNGQRATWNGTEYVVDASPQGSALGGGYRLQPMETPAQRTQAEQFAYRQQQDAIDNARADRTEDRLAASAPSDPYQSRFEQGRAAFDVARYGEAQTGAAGAGALEARANRAISMLDRGAPTGPMSGFRIMTGRMMGGTPLSALPGIPNREQTQQLEQIRLIGSQGALGDVGQLKGPLSEKELAFIQNLQISPEATPETNRVVAEAMRWTARRQAAYGAAMDRWRINLGSPSEPNANGETFDSWWSRYSAQALPMPGTPEAEALAAWQAQNPGREAAVVQPEAVRGPAPVDAASGQPVATRGVYNPATGEIEWQ
jgi:hypothetical protein